MEEEEYSVWALPPPEVRNRIKALMSALRSEFGGPEFDPHITLVWATRIAREPATRYLRSASESLGPYTTRVAAVSGRHLLYEATPKMIEASAHCCGLFGYKLSRPYRPCSSLLYGELREEEEEKEKVQKRVEELDKGIIGLTFQVSSIGLAKTNTKDESLKSWEIVEIVSLE